MSKWQKLACLAKTTCDYSFSCLVYFCFQRRPFDFTTAGAWDCGDCVAATKLLSVLHYFIFLPIAITLLWNVETDEAFKANTR